MSVIVKTTADVADICHLVGHLKPLGLATIPPMPAGSNPDHYLVKTADGGHTRLAWALTAGTVATMAAALMTYGDTMGVTLDGPPSWDTDWFIATDCTTHGDLADMATDLYSKLDSLTYNAMSNGGSDFMPAAAAHILTGLRDSLPVKSSAMWGLVANIPHGFYVA